MPKFRVTGDICCGAFTAIVEAATPDDALDQVDAHLLDDDRFFDGVSYEKAFAQAQVAEMIEE